jgi:hypothetical protein
MTDAHASVTANVMFSEDAVAIQPLHMITLSVAIPSARGVTVGELRKLAAVLHADVTRCVDAFIARTVNNNGAGQATSV